MKPLAAIFGLILLCSGTFKTDSTDLTVVNGTSYDLGDCTFSGGGSDIQFEVAPSGEYDKPIDFTVDSVSIEGQTVVKPNAGPIVLANGAEISVEWPSLNDVEIVHDGKTTSPVE